MNNRAWAALSTENLEVGKLNSWGPRLVAPHPGHVSNFGDRFTSGVEAGVRRMQGFVPLLRKQCQEPGSPPLW